MDGRVVEDNRVEYKEGWSPSDTIHTICAFANDYSNVNSEYIVIGIKTKDGIPIVTIRQHEGLNVNRAEITIGNGSKYDKTGVLKDGVNVVKDDVNGVKEIHANIIEMIKIESKEALQMAGELLMSVSQDEKERAIFRSRRMYQSDLESNMATAEKKGVLSVAKNLLKMGLSTEKIMEATGLTRKEIEELTGFK